MDEAIDLGSYDLVPTPVLVHGPEGIVHANRALLRLLGTTSASALVGRPLRDLVRASDGDAAASLEVTADGPTAGSARVHLRRAGGAADDDEGDGVPVDVVQEAHPSAPLAVAAITDVSDRVEAEDRLRRTQTRIQALMEHSSDIVAVHRGGRFRYLSPSVTRILGWAPEEMVGRRLEDFVHPDDLHRMAERIEDRKRGNASPGPGRYRLAHRDGGWRWIATVSTAHFDDPAIGGVVVNGRDVTAEVEAADALARSEVRHRALVEHLSDLIIVTDEVGRVRYVSPAVDRVLGPMPHLEALGTAFEALHPDDLEVAQQRFGEAIRNGPGVYGPHRYRFVNDDGSLRHIEVSASNRVLDPAVEGLILVVRDVTAQHRAEEQLRHLAMHDPLTGIANRSLLRDDLERALAWGRRHGTSTAVLVIDLDRFKPVNDRFGHDAGDTVLCTLADRMAASIREVDSLARLGGDEFAAVLPGAGTASDAVDVARRLVDAARTPVELAGEDLVVGASIGIALAPRHGDDPDALLTRADVAMFAAKAEGAAVCVHGEAPIDG